VAVYLPEGGGLADEQFQKCFPCLLLLLPEEESFLPEFLCVSHGVLFEKIEKNFNKPPPMKAIVSIHFPAFSILFSFFSTLASLAARASDFSFASSTISPSNTSTFSFFSISFHFSCCPDNSLDFMVLSSAGASTPVPAIVSSLFLQ